MALRVAISQFPVSGDMDANVRWISTHAHEAAKHDAQSRTFPKRPFLATSAHCECLASVWRLSLFALSRSLATARIRLEPDSDVKLYGRFGYPDGGSATVKW